VPKNVRHEKTCRLPTLAICRVVHTGPLAALLLVCGVYAIRAHPVNQAGEVSAPVPTQVSERSVTALYQEAHPYLDWPTQRLIEVVPKLKGLKPATDQDPLPTILKKTGENVDSFFHNFVNTTSRERIRQTASIPRGSWMDLTDSNYQDGYYVVLMISRGGQDRFEEYRTDLKGKPIENGGGRQGFMLTRGFAGTEIYLHSSRQPESIFRYLGRQTRAGRQCDVIAFAQLVGQATPIGFTTSGVSVPLLEQGVVWIDSTSNQIIRMRTDLLAPLTKIGLNSSTAEIEYAPVHFAAFNQTFWLPTEVQVVVNFRGAIYTNRHKYSEWRLFNVETKEIHHGPPLDPQNPADKR
jgi:hypothetical protein